MSRQLTQSWRQSRPCSPATWTTTVLRGNCTWIRHGRPPSRDCRPPLRQRQLAHHPRHEGTPTVPSPARLNRASMRTQLRGDLAVPGVQRPAASHPVGHPGPEGGSCLQARRSGVGGWVIDFTQHPRSSVRCVQMNIDDRAQRPLRSHEPPPVRCASTPRRTAARAPRLDVAKGRLVALA